MKQNEKREGKLFERSRESGKIMHNYYLRSDRLFWTRNGVRSFSKGIPFGSSGTC